ncbi:hypothetical protein CFter6_5354 [Collimonas fungivorans]|uniref:Uncharacterized protein n=1 Tax=Collimonas fungivorans TaxID=158899 RepID=A0A127PKH9_9BURK|nr:hypothetical protein CFter6_5354 [Collimonas fungivorans]
MNSQIYSYPQKSRWLTTTTIYIYKSLNTKLKKPVLEKSGGLLPKKDF